MTSLERGTELLPVEDKQNKKSLPETRTDTELKEDILETIGIQVYV